MKNSFGLQWLAFLVFMIIAMPASANIAYADKSQALNELTFKEIMRAFYSDHLEHIEVKDEEIEKLPHIGIGKTAEQNHIVAVMHPAISYTGLDGLERAFVVIEKIEANDDGELMNACHACTAKADLLLFKKAADQNYYLLSTSVNDELLSSSNGRLDIDLTALKQNIQPLGHNIIGSFYESFFYGQGASEGVWDIVHFNEDKPIIVFGSYRDMELFSSENNGGQYDEDSPLYYGYESTIEVEGNGEQYYPLHIQFKGDERLDNGKIVKNNKRVILNFDPVQNKYQSKP